MPIKIIFQNRQACPVVVCDQCGKRIDKAEKGNALWGEGPKHSLFNDGQFYCAHKECNLVFEASHPLPKNLAWASNGLEVFLAYLLDNLPFDKKAAAQRASLLKNLG
jgi:hypothetical protein